MSNLWGITCLPNLAVVVYFWVYNPPHLFRESVLMRGIINTTENSLFVMNLVATHYNCTSPMDYISHHALHSHIPIHHYTNHTAVTIHSLALIVSPHLHLFHTHTFKQHSHMHSPRSLVLAPADISERLPFPLIDTSVCDSGLPYLGTLNLCLWPRPLPGIVYVSALPLIFLLLPADHCLFDSASVYALGSTRLWPVFTLLLLNDDVFWCKNLDNIITW